MISMGGGDRFHRYNATARWTGSTAAGYEEYSRNHEVTLPSNSIRLEMSADGAFKGAEELLNPELMLIGAVVSCQLLSFLAVAARSQIEVVHYEDTGEAVMPDVMGRTGITNITLNPRITVRGEVDTARIKRLVELAHQECYVANSLKSLVILNPEITVIEAGAEIPSHLAAPQAASRRADAGEAGTTVCASPAVPSGGRAPGRSRPGPVPAGPRAPAGRARGATRP